MHPEEVPLLTRGMEVMVEMIGSNGYETPLFNAKLIMCEDANVPLWTRNNDEVINSYHGEGIMYLTTNYVDRQFKKKIVTFPGKILT
jgi:hypothetical protein